MALYFLETRHPCRVPRAGGAHCTESQMRPDPYAVTKLDSQARFFHDYFIQLHFLPVTEAT